jgi:hypothetical protein
MVDFSFLEDDSEKIEFINSIGNLIQNGEISAESLNECLANYFSITRYILTLYESVSLEDDMLKLEYKTWYAEKFLESKTNLNKDVTAKTKMASTTEIEQNLIVSNKSQYVDWQQRLIISEKRKSFYLRILESWKANSQQIIQLAQNARTEIFSLKTQDKANEDITKEKLIRHVKDENYSYDEFDSESETPPNTSTVKKVKKVVS